MMDKKVIIIGAGTMGRGIGIVFAGNDYKVELVDQTVEMALKAKDSNIAVTKELIEKNFFNKDWQTKVENNITYFGEDKLPELLPKTTLIIESVFEDVEVKDKLYKTVNQYISKDCIICSNTSALDIFKIAKLRYPENLIITHWFNPPYIMELVEVVKGEKTSNEVVETVKGILLEVGKKPSVINQYIAGFIVNRLGAALMREASYMVMQGWTTPSDIDTAMELTCGIRYGFEGPMRLYDVVGWNIIQAGAKAMYPTLCNDSEDGNPLAKKLIEKDDLGVSSGRGVFDYSDTSANEYLSERNETIINMQQYIRKSIKKPKKK